MGRTEEAETGDEEGEGKRPKPKRKFETPLIARTTSFNVEVAATGIGKCQMCFKRVEQGEVRLVIKAKTSSFLRKVGLCKSCSFRVTQDWTYEIGHVIETLKDPHVRCPKCKDHGPMDFMVAEIQKKGPPRPGWVCRAQRHFFAKLRQILWPPRKRGV